MGATTGTYPQLTENFMEFIVGVEDTGAGKVWENRLRGCSSIEVIECKPNAFGKDANLDIEIMATSLVVVRLGLPASYNIAGVYHRLPEGEYVGTVIVPPALNKKLWPEALGGPNRVKDLTSNDFNLLCRSFEITSYKWMEVLSALAIEAGKLHTHTLRAGFHSESIGFFKTDIEDNINAFLAAFAECCNDIG